MIELLLFAASVPATDPSVAILAAAVADAAQDAATRAAIISMFSLTIQTVGAVAIAWIAYKQAQLTKNMKLLETNTNSIKDELVAVTKTAGILQGKVEGREELRSEQAARLLSKTKGGK